LKNVISALRNIVKGYPALTAGLANVVIVLAARWGIHVTADQLAGLGAAVAAILAGIIHASVSPTQKPAPTPPVAEAGKR
jgi:hypothetical protein